MKSNTKLLIVACCNIALQMLVILHSVMMFIDASVIELIFSTEYAKAFIFSFVTIISLNSVLYVILYKKDSLIKKNNVNYINIIKAILNNVDIFSTHRNNIKNIHINTAPEEIINLSIRMRGDIKYMYSNCDRMHRVIYDKNVRIVELENKVDKLQSINKELRILAGTKENDAIDHLINSRITERRPL